MNAEQRANIGRGVKEANRRKRLSKAMKLSWRQRRELRLQTLNNKPNDPAKLVDIAVKVLGYDEVALVLRNAITYKLDSL